MTVIPLFRFLKQGCAVSASMGWHDRNCNPHSNASIFSRQDKVGSNSTDCMSAVVRQQLEKEVLRELEKPGRAGNVEQ